MNPVIQELRRRRKVFGLTQQQVAERIGVVRSSVANFERDNQDMPLSKVEAYAALVGVRLIPIPREFLL